jgi:hypothetical protein
MSTNGFGKDNDSLWKSLEWWILGGKTNFDQGDTLPLSSVRNSVSDSNQFTGQLQ